MRKSLLFSSTVFVQFAHSEHLIDLTAIAARFTSSPNAFCATINALDENYTLLLLLVLSTSYFRNANPIKSLLKSTLQNTNDKMSFIYLLLKRFNLSCE